MEGCFKTFLKCLPLLVIKEMQIKTILRFCVNVVSIALIRDTEDNRCWFVCGEIGTIIYCECSSIKTM